jgi:hypothetical protein
VSYDLKIIADSIANGVRITTIQGTFPRFILAEVNTIRQWNRNSASSRAIPVKVRLEQVRSTPFVPASFGKNRAGMQATEALEGDEASIARDSWLRAMTACAHEAELMEKLGVHKQYANRVLEPFSWHTAVITATHWRNALNLRTHKDAQPEFQTWACMLRDALSASKPQALHEGMWHLPYIRPEEWAELADLAERDWVRWEAFRQELVKRSVVRCAAVSFERQDAERTPEQMLARFDGLKTSGHWSPFEHQAKVANESEIRDHANHRWDKDLERFVPDTIGPLSVPWLQLRKTIPGEDVWTPPEERRTT